MASIKSIRSLTLDIPPSCIEFVPGYPELFVIGTYYLKKKDEGEDDAAESTSGQPQQRTGSLLLFRLDGGEVTLQHTLTTPFAIFDIHFAPATTSATASPLLGAATSTGSLALYQISASSTPSSTPSIVLLSVLQVFPTTSLITHFAWHPSIPSIAALALASGSIYLFDTAAFSADPTVVEPGDTTPTAAHLHAHSLEAWFVAFAADGRALLSGGDDAALASIALPTPEPSASSSSSASKLLAFLADAPPTLQWQDRKTHQAGVTAILPLASQPSKANEQASEEQQQQQQQLLLTGSYDDHIRLLALPTATSFPRRPALLAELDVGGGVWRLKDITDENTSRNAEEGPATEYMILASCMHAGARVLRLRGPSSQKSGGEDGAQEWSFEVLAAFEEHESMNYGSDVQPGRGGGAGGSMTVVSTSFYDRLLAVWRW